MRESDLLLLPNCTGIAAFLPRKYISKRLLPGAKSQTHQINQVKVTTPMRKMKPPAAPPAMGAILLDDLEAGLDKAELEVNVATGGVEVDVIVNTVVSPLSSVEVCSVVTGKGKGVVVIVIVVTVGDGCGYEDWVMVLIGINVLGQLA
jgi:hypothetical protein